MKNRFLFITLFISIHSIAFSLSESGVSLGFGYDFIYHKYTYNNEKFKYTNNSPGIIINGFYFRNKDDILGIYTNFIFGFPQAVHLYNNSEEKTVAINYNLQVGMNFGGVFKKIITEKITFYYGCGLNFILVFSDYYQTTKELIEKFEIKDFNIGGAFDIGFRYRLANKLFINTGIIYTLGLYQYKVMNSIDSLLTKKDWEKDITYRNLKPYIYLGMFF